MASRSDFRLGGFKVLTAENVVEGPDGEVHVSPRAMDVLVLLAERAGEVVSRDEFGDAIWAPSVVTDDSITRCISELRRALGDQTGEPHFIKTVPKRGYQLIAPVEPPDDQPGTTAGAVNTQAAAGPHRGRMFTLLGALAAAVGLAVYLSGPTEVPVTRDPSIAVLAFEDLSPGADHGYFAEGISEEILNALARIPELKVAGRTSAFSFKDQHRDLREIGRALDVAHVLEGSVRRQDDRVRITAQLVATDDGFHLWSETYDRELGDVFAVQDDISRSVSGELSRLLGFQAQPPTFQRVDSAAYDLYLRGRAQLARRGVENLLRAAELFQAATLIQPDFDAAVAGRARALSIVWQYAPEQEATDENAGIARTEALRALELEPENAEALSTLAYISAAFDRDFERAVELTEKAIELAPNQASIANFAGDIFRFVGDFERMLAWEHRARELEPRAWFHASDLALAHYVVQDYQSALEWSDKALALNPEGVAALNIRTKSALRLGDVALARKSVARLDAVEQSIALSARVEIDAAEFGPDPETESYKTLIEMVENGEYPKTVSVARIATLYGDHARAAALIERATARHEPFLNFPYRFLPEHWPADPRIQAALDHPNLHPLWEIRRRLMPEDIEPIR